jgi:hypothetical protein
LASKPIPATPASSVFSILCSRRARDLWNYWIRRRDSVKQRGLAVGRNPGSFVTTIYASPLPFTGRITKVTVDVSENPDHDDDAVKESQARVAMARE